LVKLTVWGMRTGGAAVIAARIADCRMMPAYWAARVATLWLGLCPGRAPSCLSVIVRAGEYAPEARAGGGEGGDGPH
jgi:hypothetical protein